MSVGAVNKSTGDRIPTAGMPAIDNALSLISTNPVQNAIITAALAGKQATLTFDSAPTDGSTNPVESNGVYDALALKQNATDNNLQTTDKTVVGAINEHEGDISSLMSGLTDLNNYHRLVAVSETTGTLKDKINSLTTAWNALTNEERSRSYLVYSNGILNVQNYNQSRYGSPARWAASSSSLVFYIAQINSTDSTYIAVSINSNGFTYDDRSATEDNETVSLYV